MAEPLRFPKEEDYTYSDGVRIRNQTGYEDDRIRRPSAAIPELDQETPPPAAPVEASATTKILDFDNPEDWAFLGMSDAPTHRGVAEPSGFGTGSYGTVLRMGANQLAQAAVGVADLLGVDVRSSQKFLEQAFEKDMASLRPEVRQDIEAKWAQLDGNSIINNPDAAITQLVMQLPTVASIMVPGLLAGRAAGAAAALRGADAAAAGARAGAITGGALEGTAVAGFTQDQVRDAITSMPQAMLDQAPAYQQLLDQPGATPESAREALIRSMKPEALTTGAISSIFGAAAGAYFGRAIASQTGSRLGNAARGAVVEGPLTEGPQEVVEEAGAAAAIQQADPSYTSDLAESYMAGSGLGAGFGAPVGAAMPAQRPPASLDDLNADSDLEALKKENPALWKAVVDRYGQDTPEQRQAADIEFSRLVGETDNQDQESEFSDADAELAAAEAAKGSSNRPPPPAPPTSPVAKPAAPGAKPEMTDAEVEAALVRQAAIEDKEERLRGIKPGEFDVATPKVAPVPESQATIDAQTEAVKDPTSAKDAVVVTPGSPMPSPDVAEGLGTAQVRVAGVEQPYTVVSDDPELLSALDDADEITEDDLSQILYGRPGGKEGSTGLAVVARNAEGAVVSEVATSPENFKTDLANATAAMPAGGSVSVSTVAEQLAERQEAVDAEAVTAEAMASAEQDVAIAPLAEAERAKVLSGEADTATTTAVLSNAVNKFFTERAEKKTTEEDFVGKTDTGTKLRAGGVLKEKLNRLVTAMEEFGYAAKGSIPLTSSSTQLSARSTAAVVNQLGQIVRTLGKTLPGVDVNRTVLEAIESGDIEEAVYRIDAVIDALTSSTPGSTRAKGSPYEDLEAQTEAAIRRADNYANENNYKPVKGRPRGVSAFEWVSSIYAMRYAVRQLADAIADMQTHGEIRANPKRKRGKKGKAEIQNAMVRGKEEGKRSFKLGYATQEENEKYGKIIQKALDDTKTMSQVGFDQINSTTARKAYKSLREAYSVLRNAPAMQNLKTRSANIVAKAKTKNTETTAEAQRRRYNERKATAARSTVIQKLKDTQALTSKLRNASTEAMVKSHARALASYLRMSDIPADQVEAHIRQTLKERESLRSPDKKEVRDAVDMETIVEDMAAIGPDAADLEALENDADFTDEDAAKEADPFTKKEAVSFSISPASKSALRERGEKPSEGVTLTPEAYTEKTVAEQLKEKRRAKKEEAARKAEAAARRKIAAAAEKAKKKHKGIIKVVVAPEQEPTPTTRTPVSEPADALSSLKSVAGQLWSSTLGIAKGKFMDLVQTARVGKNIPQSVKGVFDKNSPFMRAVAGLRQALSEEQRAQFDKLVGQYAAQYKKALTENERRGIAAAIAQLVESTGLSMPDDIRFVHVKKVVHTQPRKQTLNPRDEAAAAELRVKQGNPEATAAEVIAARTAAYKAAQEHNAVAEAFNNQLSDSNIVVYTRTFVSEEQAAAVEKSKTEKVFEPPLVSVVMDYVEALRFLNNGNKGPHFGLGYFLKKNADDQPQLSSWASTQLERMLQNRLSAHWHDFLGDSASDALESMLIAIEEKSPAKGELAEVIGLAWRAIELAPPVHLETSEDLEAAGVYQNGPLPFITLHKSLSNGQAMAVMIHEVVHAAMVDVVNAVAAGQITDPRAVEALQGIYGVLNIARAAAKARGVSYYGLTDLHEFIAEANSSTVFREFLRSVPADGTPEAPSLLRRFYNFVRQLFGLSPKFQRATRNVVSVLTNVELNTTILSDYQAQARPLTQSEIDSDSWILPKEEFVSGEIVGRHALYIGEGAQDTRKTALSNARLLKAARMSDDKILAATGWFFNPLDQKWRYEISDVGAQYDGTKYRARGSEDLLDPNNKYARDRKNPLTLGEIFSHPTLFKHYPEAAQLKVVSGGMFGVDGAYDPDTQTIFIKDWLHRDEENVSTLLHEIQHYIQHREGFARGGNSKTAAQYMTDKQVKLYLSLQKDKAQKQWLDRAEMMDRYKDMAARHPEDPYWAQYLVTLEQAVIKLKAEYDAAAAALKKRDRSAVDGYEAYRNLAGEQEARDVETRFKSQRNRAHNNLMDTLGIKPAHPNWTSTSGLADYREDSGDDLKLPFPLKPRASKLDIVHFQAGQSFSMSSSVGTIKNNISNLKAAVNESTGLMDKLQRGFLGVMNLDVIERANRKLDNSIQRAMKFVGGRPLKRIVDAITQSSALAREIQDTHIKLTQDTAKLDFQERQDLYEAMIESTMAGVFLHVPLTSPMNEHLFNTKTGKLKDAAAVKKALTARNKLTPRALKLWRQWQRAMQQERQIRLGVLVKHAAKSRGVSFTEAAELYRAVAVSNHTGDYISSMLTGIKAPHLVGNVKQLPNTNKLNAEALTDLARLVKDILNENEIVGPYFPLYRGGNYAVVVEDGAAFEMYDTEREANKAKAAHLRAGRSAIVTRALNEYGAANAEAVQALAAQIEQKAALEVVANASPAARKAIEEQNKAINAAVNKILAARVLYSARLKRKNIPGMQAKDMAIALESHSRASVSVVSSLDAAFDFNTGLRDLREAALSTDLQHEGVVSQDEQIKLGDLYNEIVLRSQNLATDRDVTLTDRVLGRIGFFTYLGSPAYWMLNATQTATVGMPVLAGLANVSAWQAIQSLKKSMVQIRKLTKGMGWRALLDMDPVISKLPKVQQDTIRQLVDDGAIQSTLSHEVGVLASADLAFGQTTPGKFVVPAYNFVTDILQSVPDVIERFNRLSMALAAIDAGVTNYETIKDIVLASQFNYDAANRGRLLRYMPKWAGGGARHVWSPIMMFKVFGVQMAHLLYGNLYDGFLSRAKTPEERARARKIFFGLLGSHTVFGGITGGLGLGLGSIILGAVNSFLDDEDKYDPATSLREFLEEHVGEYAARVAMKGAPAALGVDLTGSVNLGSLIFMSRDNDWSQYGGFEQSVYSMLGPVAQYIGAGVVRPTAQLMDGDISVSRWAESAVPMKFIKSLMQSWRQQTEGLETASGHAFMGGEDISLGDAAITALGLRTTAVTERQEKFYRDRNYSITLENRKAEIVGKLRDATSADDRADAEREKREWNAKMRERRNHSLIITSRSVERSRQSKSRVSQDYAKQKFTPYN